jgi:uncharacterized protein YkwD
MWQSLHFRRTQRHTVRRRTHLGLLACLLSVLLIGIVIGRTTFRPGGADEVYLDNAPPAHNGAMRAAAEPTPTPSPTATGVKGFSDRNRAGKPTRSSLVPVVRDTGGATTAPRPRTTSRAHRPGNTIEGIGGGDAASVFTADGGDFDTGKARLQAIETGVVRLVNVQRRKAGCRPLRVDSRLVKSARRHSAEMAHHNHFGHDSPNGASPWDRMEAAGYHNGGAENIARGYLTAEDAVRGWMGDRHRKGNILNCRLVATGVGVSPGPGGPWWTQDFGYS